MTTAPPDDPRRDGPEEEEEVHPPDFIIALCDFMEDVCSIEAHIWAAERALRDARMIDDIRLADDGLEATLGRDRAYFLLNSVADAAEKAAERAHKLRMPLVAYCSRQRVDLWRKLDEEDEAREAAKVAVSGEETLPEAGNVAESGEAPPEAGEPQNPGTKSGRKGRRKGGRA
jgi:hypothetical protein